MIQLKVRLNQLLLRRLRAFLVEESHRIVRESHHQGRYRRSIVDSDGSPIVSLNFTAKGYHFSLLLHSDSSVFAEGYEVEDNKGHSLLHKIDHLVSGKLVDQPGSHAEGQLRKGVFSGTIFSPLWGTFYVERRGEAGATHSVIYHENEIELPENFGSCKEMKHTPADFSAAMEAYHYNEPERVRRESDEVHEEDQRNTCIMRIQVDHMFSSEYRRCPGMTDCTRVPLTCYMRRVLFNLTYFCWSGKKKIKTNFQMEDALRVVLSIGKRSLLSSPLISKPSTRSTSNTSS